MIRLALILIGTATAFNLVYAESEDFTVEQIYDLAQNVLNATNKWQQDLREYQSEGRKSKFFPFGLLPFHALWGFGGLNALAVLFAIKFKIIVIASIVAFSVYYYTQFAAKKKCAAAQINPLTAYSNSYGDTASSYNLVPYGSYHDSIIHSGIPSHVFGHEPHHEYYDFDHHSGEYEHSPYGNVPSNGFSSTESDSKDFGSSSTPSMSVTYRRVGKQRKKRAQGFQPDLIDIGELAVRFLGVNTEGCRRRFVCELDFRAQVNPITRLAFTFIGRNFFEKYRHSDENGPKPQKFEDCAKVFNDCEDAEKYDNDVAEHEESEHGDDVKN